MATNIVHKINRSTMVGSNCNQYVEKEDSFLQLLYDMNLAVDEFMRQYESLHQVTILDYDMQKETRASGYFISGVVQLNFNFRHKADQQPQSSSVILKIPQLGAFQDYAKQFFLYDKERYMYEKVLPSMHHQWSGGRENVLPNCYATTPSGILVLENLKESGFYPIESGALLDLATSKVVLKALARFHASLSSKVVDDFHANLDSLSVTDKGDSEWSKRIYQPIVNKLRKHVLPLCSTGTRKAFDAYIDQINYVFKLSLSPNEDGYNVVLHGELHSYNLLLKHNPHHQQSDDVTQCKLIDFQWSRRGSPILDIMLFLVTSVDFDVFENDHASLFGCYLDELENCLKESRPDEPCPYGLKDLFGDFDKYKLSFLYPLICCVPIFWSGKRDLRSIGEENEIDAIMKSVKYLSFFRGWIKYLLPREI